MAEPERTIPFHDPTGLTWDQLEGLLNRLHDDLRYAREKFHSYVRGLRDVESMVYSTREMLSDLNELVKKYEQDVAKLTAISQLVKEKLQQVESAVEQLEQIDYHPVVVNKERQLMYKDIVTLNDTFLKDVQSMTEVKSALKQLDDLMVKVHGIEQVKSGLNAMINLLTFLSRAINHLESETTKVMQNVTDCKRNT